MSSIAAISGLQKKGPMGFSSTITPRPPLPKSIQVTNRPEPEEQEPSSKAAQAMNEVRKSAKAGVIGKATGFGRSAPIRTSKAKIGDLKAKGEGVKRSMAESIEEKKTKILSSKKDWTNF